MICATQSFSLEVNYMAATVPMQGYDEGKLVEVGKTGRAREGQPRDSPDRLGAVKENGWMVEDDARGGAVHRVLTEDAVMYVLPKDVLILRLSLFIPNQAPFAIHRARSDLLKTDNHPCRRRLFLGG
jgi:hypothetical protein